MELNSYIAILAPPKHKNQPTAALVAVELNNYITILAPPKHKNQPIAVELKVFFFFTFIVTVHSYLWLCTITKSKKNKK